MQDFPRRSKKLGFRTFHESIKYSIHLAVAEIKHNSKYSLCFLKKVNWQHGSVAHPDC